MSRTVVPKSVYAPLLVISACFALGIIFGNDKSIPISQLILISILAVILAILATQTDRKTIRILAILIAFFAAGVFRISLSQIQPTNLWRNYDNITEFSGVVVSYPEHRTNFSKFTLRIRSVTVNEKHYKASGKVLIYIVPSSKLEIGDQIAIKGIPELVPESAANFFIHNYGNYLRNKGISGSLRTYRKNVNFVKSDFKYILLKKLARLREIISIKIKGILPGNNGALLEGIIFGRSSSLPRNIKDKFSNAGVYHILAVSGLHVGIVAAILYWILKRLKLSRVQIAILIAIGLCIYCLFVGLRDSVVRASIMAVFILFAPLIYKRMNPFNALGAAALLILCFAPKQIFQLGFQLSFAAVIGILYFLPRIKYFLKLNIREGGNIFSYILVIFFLTVSVQLGILPIIASNFHQIHILSPIINLFVIPAVGFGLYFGFAGLFACFIHPVLGKFGICCAGSIMDFILLVVRLFDRIPFEYIAIAPPSTWTICGFYLFIIGIFNITLSKWAKFFTLTGLLLLIAPISKTTQNYNNCVLFNVEKGFAAYFECEKGNTALLCDSDFYKYLNVVKPFFLAREHKKADMFIYLDNTLWRIEGRRIAESLSPDTIIANIDPRVGVQFNWLTIHQTPKGDIMINFANRRHLFKRDSLGNKFKSCEISTVITEKDDLKYSLTSTPKSELTILVTDSCDDRIRYLDDKKLYLSDGAVWLRYNLDEIIINRP